MHFAVVKLMIAGDLHDWATLADLDTGGPHQRAMTWCQDIACKDKHIGIDFLAHFVHGRARRAMRCVTLLFAAGISSLMAWHGYGLVQLDYGTGTHVGGIPGWIVEAVLPVGFGLLALRLALRAFAAPRGDALPVLAPELP